MTRLIDADALDMYEALKSYYGDAWRDAQAVIDEAPTIDAVPVRHAKWISVNNFFEGKVYCSDCKKVFDWVAEAQYYDYCPNCGAIMDGNLLKDDTNE